MLETQSAVYETLISELRRFLPHHHLPCHRSHRTSLVERIVDRPAQAATGVGFYMLDPADPEILVLGPFVGAPTEHTRIPVTEGICGAAVAQAETVIIDDVNSDPRYLACSLETRSEIVVPIRAHGQIVGEIDIDSHTLANFGPADRSFVEACAEIVGQFIERPSSKA